MKKRNSGENKRIDYLVYIGRLTVQKGADLLPSMAELSEKKLLLFGDGELLDSIVKESRERNVEVISHGFVRDPWKLIPPNSILIIPSRWEGDGLVVVEAVLGNVPFLLSDIPEFRRFDFSDKNYCSGLNEFVKSIAKYDESLTSLEISATKANVLQNSRKPAFIAKQWMNLLESTV
jgi:glycosyltransferase involved in cell wall biosynthesis